MTRNREILILVEHRRNEIRDITYELLTIGREMAVRTKCRLSAIVLQDQNQGLGDKLTSWAETVYCVEDKIFHDFNSVVYHLGLKSFIKERKPLLTMIGHTAFGADLAPALASDLNIPIATDCIGIDLVEDNLSVTRSVYGGKLHCATKVKPAESYLVTIRPAAFPPQPSNLAGQVVKVSIPPIEDIKFRRFLEYIEAVVGEVDITKSDIVVGIGRGIKEAKNIPIIEDLARTLGGVVACSRPVVDAGWLPKERQVGSSGKTIKPKLYIAIGISGAFQHIAGMKGAQTIVAINKDPNAPIFAEAHYGIVEDLFKVVPIIKEKIAALKKG
ncbi:MAG: electron transfer flavoprotein subunit alpha/FixB family protein [candidate division WOR-3 bacterium]